MICKKACKNIPSPQPHRTTPAETPQCFDKNGAVYLHERCSVSTLTLRCIFRHDAKWQEEQAGLAEAQKRLEYWKAVKKESNRIQGIYETAPAKEKKEKADLAPQSAMEYVASMIGRLDPESYRKETGYGVAEQRKAGPIFLKKENGGMSIERLAEYICEQPEAQGWGIRQDMDAEVRDMILEVLSHGNPKAYIRNTREQQAKADAYGEENHMEQIAMREGFANADDMIAHEEVFLAEAIRSHYGLENSGYYDKLAEEYEQEDIRRNGQRNERQDNGSSVERLEEGDTGGTGQNDSEGGSVLSEEQSADTAGAGVNSTGQTSESSGTAEGSAEGVAENEAVSGESEGIEPVGRGAFGNIYNQFKRKAKEAIAFLMRQKDGEAIGALYHAEVGGKGGCQACYA